MRVKQLSTNNTGEVKNKHEISHAQLQNELNFYQVEELLMKLLKNNLITQEEFNQINKLNRQKFNPLLGPLMCNKP
ncbi:SHOCT domain-containing protein [Ornithinibacillus sp. 4-3]|uniref:SHOCT domain-containing protein n=1 Tax=Ornithinibacillus sp. 4-3 TaxID=3231488 RepID=A0AB39HR87_9BACI